MAATTHRTVNHTITDAQAARTGVHIGRDMVAPAGQLVINDIRPSDYEGLTIAVAVVNAYTGGATDPTLQLIVQRKIDYGLDDTDDDAWEDIARFRDITASTPTSPVQYEVVTLASARMVGDNLALLTSQAYVTDNDTLSAGELRPLLISDRLRIREVTTGGDRTGGTATITYHLVGNQQGWQGGL